MCLESSPLFSFPTSLYLLHLWVTGCTFWLFSVVQSLGVIVPTSLRFTFMIDSLFHIFICVSQPVVIRQVSSCCGS